MGLPSVFADYGEDGRLVRASPAGCHALILPRTRCALNGTIAAPSDRTARRNRASHRRGAGTMLRPPRQLARLSTRYPLLRLPIHFRLLAT